MTWELSHCRRNDSLSSFLDLTITIKHLCPKIASLFGKHRDRLTLHFALYGDYFHIVSARLWFGRDDSGIEVSDPLPRVFQAFAISCVSCQLNKTGLLTGQSMQIHLAKSGKTGSCAGSLAGQKVTARFWCVSRFESKASNVKIRFSP